MSYTDGDERFADFEYDLIERECIRCRMADHLEHSDYCGKCGAQIEREELEADGRGNGCVFGGERWAGNIV